MFTRQKVTGLLLVITLLLAALVAWTYGPEEQARSTSSGVEAHIAVDATTTLGTISPAAFGVNTAVWDANLLHPDVPDRLKELGVKLLRYPGGSMAEAYHWRTHSITPGVDEYAHPENTFDNFMKLSKKVGAEVLINVNYGSNADGTAGGDPAEAADWVRYANREKGYNVKYWMIGVEPYGNGFYGANWEVDRHPADKKSPADYANRCLTFIEEMKAVDPTIKVGVAIALPENWPDGEKPDWNSTVLAIVVSKIDFAAVNWFPLDPGQEDDAKLLKLPGRIPGMVDKLRAQIDKYCGENAENVEIVMVSMNSVSSNPGKQTVSMVNGLFLADSYMNWLKKGVANVTWWTLHNSLHTKGNNDPSLFGTTAYGDEGLLASGDKASGQSAPPVNTPYPTYHSYQLVTRLAGPGDQMIATASDQKLLSAHAVKKADGRLAVMLVNKDPNRAYEAHFEISGYTPGGAASVYSYGPGQHAITTQKAEDVGRSFSHTIPPYSLSTIIMEPGQK